MLRVMTPYITLQVPLSFAVLVDVAPCCCTLSSLQPCFDVLADFTPFICHSVLLIVHPLPFIWLMCPNPLTNSRKCNIVKPENLHPDRDWNLCSSVVIGREKQTCSPLHQGSCLLSRLFLIVDKLHSAVVFDHCLVYTTEIERDTFHI